MWIFTSIKNYGEMVDKISYSVFVVSSAFLFFLAQTNDEFMKALEKISFGVTIDVFNLRLCVATFYVPLIMGLFEHIFKLHDVWATIFGIRKRFDKKIIVNEFLKFAKSKKKAKDLTDIQVRKIMNNCFYQYASSTDPIIDSHYITLALTEWCWFWIIFDTLLLYDLVGIVWLGISWWNWKSFIIFIVIEILLILLLMLIYCKAGKYAKKEVNEIMLIKDKEILNDKSMKDIIKEAVKSALQNK